VLTVHYVTHSTSVDNEAGLASGHADVPLSPTGERQAREAGERLRDVPLDLVVCSDLERSWRTAEIAFAGRDLEVRRDPRLREVDYGDMTQAPRALVDAQRANRIERPFHGGESYRHAAERHRLLLRDLADELPGGVILLVGHGATDAALKHLCEGVPLLEAVMNRDAWQPIWTYTYDPSRRQIHP
jgi:broad specificity phosphatase PhoE